MASNLGDGGEVAKKMRRILVEACCVEQAAHAAEPATPAITPKDCLPKRAKIAYLCIQLRISSLSI